MARRFPLPLVCAVSVLAACTNGGVGSPPGLNGRNSSLVSNNSGSLTGIFKAPATLVSNNSGSLVSNNAGSYRIASVQDAPVPNGSVSAYELTGDAIAGTSTTTDANGAFTLHVPPGRPVLVRGTLSSGGATYAFQTVGVSTGSIPGAADITTGSTLAAGSLAQLATRKGIDIKTLITSRLGTLEQVLGTAVSSGDVSKFSEGQSALLDFVDSLLSEPSVAPLAAVLNGYTGLMTDGDTLYMADNTRGVLLKADGDSYGAWLGGGDGMFATGAIAEARFSSVYGEVKDTDGTLYFADAGNHQIRKIANGQVSTIAGSTVGFTDGQGAAAQFDLPTSLAFGPDHALYVTDTGNDRIRRVDLTSGRVTTVAGGGSTYDGDGTGTALKLSEPHGLVSDGQGALYFADTGNNEILKLTLDQNSVWQSARLAGGYGNNPLNVSIVDGPGLQAAFLLPMAMAYSNQALYVADTFDHAIRRIDLSTTGNPVTTLAGAGPQSPGTSDGSGANARFRGPDSIAVAADGTIYVGDGGNLLLRKISGGTVQTLSVNIR